MHSLSFATKLKDKRIIGYLFYIILIFILFVFAFRSYGVVLEKVWFAPRIRHVVFPVTVLGVHLNKEVFVRGENVILNVSFFIPYESGNGFFNFTVEVYRGGRLVCFLCNNRFCFAGEVGVVAFGFRLCEVGRYTVVLKIYWRGRVVYKESFNVLVI